MKKWYIIRKKGTEERWTAYQLSEKHRNQLQPQYECKGPYKSIVECLIKASS